MNTLGGFLLEPRPSSDGRQQYSESSSDATTRENHAAALRNGGTDNYNDEPVAIRKLSLKQEARLMDYLDEAFIKVNRAYQKR